jgi:hypothetical protein
MFVQCAGKLVGAILSGDKIKVLCCGRVKGRLKGINARISYRAGR